MVTLYLEDNMHALQVRPLRRQLKGLKAWITGQRKDQSPGSRSAVPVVQVHPPPSPPPSLWTVSGTLLLLLSCTRAEAVSLLYAVSCPS